MLKLKRRRGERIIITDDLGNKIIVSMEGIGTKRGQIGIDAPQKFKILREELCLPVSAADSLKLD